jgi:glucose/arabinose dehydrogenase
MKPAGRLAWVSAVVVLAAGGLGACTTSQPSGSPGATSLSAGPSAAPSGGPSASLPASSPAAAFDATAVSITLKAWAKVPGGPLAIVSPPDGSGRLFVASKDGTAWVVRDGVTGSTPLLDLRGKVSTGGEQGLLGIAVHPGFPADPRVFVDYTDESGDTVVASYAIDPGTPGVLDPASRRVILHVDQPYANHNGGALAFGPDGKLYVSLGDGGSGGDPQGNGQSLETLLGKILRIDVDVPPRGSDGYAIPPDNPFVDTADADPEIWLYGLRNPWRIAFDRATGDLWIGDVGQNAWEEVDVVRAGQRGLNFGWNRLEGSHCYNGCDRTGVTMPVAEYSHAEGGCTVIGGAVYRGAAYPILQGGYVFADYCSGRIFAVSAATDGPTNPVRVGTAGDGLAAFGEDAAGELYAANLDGTIYQVVATRR